MEYDLQIIFMRRIQNWLLVSDISQYTLYISDTQYIVYKYLSNDIILLHKIDIFIGKVTF